MSSQETIRKAMDKLCSPEQPGRTDDEPGAARDKILAGLEAKHPTEPKPGYLVHQPEGSAKELVQKGWEHLHPTGLKPAPQREEKANG